MNSVSLLKHVQVLKFAVWKQKHLGMLQGIRNSTLHRLLATCSCPLSKDIFLCALFFLQKQLLPQPKQSFLYLCFFIDHWSTAKLSMQRLCPSLFLRKLQKELCGWPVWFPATTRQSFNTRSTCRRWAQNIWLTCNHMFALRLQTVHLSQSPVRTNKQEMTRRIVHGPPLQASRFS